MCDDYTKHEVWNIACDIIISWNIWYFFFSILYLVPITVFDCYVWGAKSIHKACGWSNIRKYLNNNRYIVKFLFKQNKCVNIFIKIQFAKYVTRCHIFHFFFCNLYCNSHRLLLFPNGWRAPICIFKTTIVTMFWSLVRIFITFIYYLTRSLFNTSFQKKKTLVLKFV